MSLADELLADLEEDDVLNDFHSNSNELPNESNFENTQKQYSSVRTLAKIIDSDELKRVIYEITQRQSNDCKFLLFILIKII